MHLLGGACRPFPGKGENAGSTEDHTPQLFSLPDKWYTLPDKWYTPGKMEMELVALKACKVRPETLPIKL